MTTPIPTLQRVASIDALRGFALAGVAAVHMIDRYLAGALPAGAEAVAMPGPVDQLLAGLNAVFMTGKFYVLFSLLFGLSFFIQMHRAEQRDIDFRGRFAWRLILLFVIGFLHHFLFRGDILMVYGLLGMLMIPLYRASRGVLFGIAAVLLLGAGRYLSFALFGGGSFFGEDPYSLTSPQVRHYYDILTEGSLLDVFAVNAVGGLHSNMDFQLGIFGRAYVTLGLFCIGLWLGRTRFFETLTDERQRIRRGLWISIAASLVSVGLTIFLFMRAPQPMTFDTWDVAFALTGYDLVNLSLASTYLFLFAWIYLRGWGERILRLFEPFGRMALTNYLLQSLLGTFIFYGWGLGRLGEWGYLYAFSIGVVVIALQMFVSRIWMRHFLYGPVEWLWRSLTWMKVFPFRRGAPKTAST